MNRAAARLDSLVEFFAPAPLVAVALLALNDRVLKSRFHNGLTGKLSDVALCFFLPLYLSALLGLVRGRMAVERRLVVGALVTVVAFVALELSDAAGAWLTHATTWVAAPLGIGRVRLTRDPTDLLALLLVPVAWWYGRWRGWRAARFSTAETVQTTDMKLPT